jgi:RimJ/RimL family protein N-acetyltransferase
MSINIREATPDDAEQILTLTQGVLAEPNIDVPFAPEEYHFTIDEARKLIASYAASDNSLLLIAETDGEIMGILRCVGGNYHSTRHAVELGSTVRRDWRGKGVGSALLERAIAWAKGATIVKRIEVHVYARDTGARRLYEKFGFVVEGKRQRVVCHHGVYLDDLVMALLL